MARVERAADKAARLFVRFFKRSWCWPSRCLPAPVPPNGNTFIFLPPFVSMKTRADSYSREKRRAITPPNRLFAGAILRAESGLKSRGHARRSALRQRQGRFHETWEAVSLKYDLSRLRKLLVLSFDSDFNLLAMNDEYTRHEEMAVFVMTTCTRKIIAFRCRNETFRGK